MLVYSIITKEKNWFVATAIPSGVVSQGKTIEETKANLQEALELFYEDQPIEDSGSEPLIAPVQVKTNIRA